MSSPEVITRPGPLAVPYAYTIAATEQLRIRAAFASWDGTGASGAFLPCLSFYTQDGKLFSRVFPSQSVSAGGVADVSYAPFPGGIGQSSGVSVGTWQYATPIAPASAGSGWAAGAAFVNGWGNTQLADGSYNPLRYRTTPAGVQLTGAISGGSLGTTVVTMPAGYVPPFDTEAVVGSAIGATTFTVAVNAATGAMSVLGGGGPAVILTRGVFTGNVSTTGTTFAAGADLLASPLTFVADGSSAYLVTLYSTAYTQSGTGSVLVHLNLDGLDGGICTGASLPGGGFDQVGWASAYIPALAAGAHTVNLRITANAGTASVLASVGRPALITVERLP